MFLVIFVSIWSISVELSLCFVSIESISFELVIFSLGINYVLVVLSDFVRSMFLFLFWSLGFLFGKLNIVEFGVVLIHQFLC